MKKTVLFLFALVASIGAMAQTNLVSGKTVVPLGGLKHYAVSDVDDTHVDYDFTISNDDLQKLTTTNNADNVLLYPEQGVNGAASTSDDYKNVGIQGFYIDLGADDTEVKEVIITWEGATAKAYNIYVTNTKPADNGTVTGTAAIERTDLGQVTSNKETLTTNNKGRYIVFEPTEAFNYQWGVKMRTFQVYGEATTAVLTTFTATAAKTTLKVGNTTTISTTAKDQFGIDFPVTLTYGSSKESVATIADGTITAVAAGTAVITVTPNGIAAKAATIDITVEDAVVLPATAPAAPTGDVHIIYDGTTGEWSAEGWGWGSAQSDVVINDKTCRLGENLGGMQIPNDLKDYTVYTQLKVDVWSANEHSLNVYFEGEGTTKVVNLTTGWNEVVVPIEGIDGSKVNYLTFQYDNSATKTGVLIFSNIYYAKGAVVVPFNISSTGVVTGDVTTSNVAAINASTSSVINLAEANIKEAITLNPVNKNAVVVVGGTGRTPDANGAKVTAKNIVVFDNTYRRAKDGVVIALVDDNESQPDYAFVIDARQDGFSYSREIAADQWISFNSPAPVTIPDGITVYKATDATASQVTFTKQDNQALGANDAVILHNTGAATTITSDVLKSDLNLTANGAATAVKGSIMQQGTSRAVEADGTQFALKNGALHQFNTGAKIGAFRVYYTGLAGSEARAIFVDNNTTLIGTIKADGRIEMEKAEIYDLNGHRVLNPTKGLYIVNGKKMIIK